MNLPSVPSDNFYKFLAIGSLASIVILCYAVLTEAYEIDKKRFELRQGAELILYDVKEIKTFIHKIQVKAKIACGECNCPCAGPQYNIDSLTVIYPDSSKYNKEIEAFLKESNIKSGELLKSSFILKQKQQEIEYYNGKLIELGIFGLIILCVLLFIMFTSFEYWYNRVQYFQDEILKAEFIQKRCYTTCQSCGVNLTVTKKGLELDNSINNKYCIHCYNDGKFTEDISLEEMKEKVIPILKKKKYDKIHRFFYLRKLNRLERWSKVFKWESCN